MGGRRGSYGTGRGPERIGERRRGRGEELEVVPSSPRASGVPTWWGMVVAVVMKARYGGSWWWVVKGEWEGESSRSA